MSRPAERASAVRTFLIADVRGYTAYTREHGDEAAARLARKLEELAREAAEAFGGVVLELRGDEVLVAFASARLALRAGVELQDAFAHETEFDPALPLHVGIGIAAGEAVPVGEGFRGAALNLAGRLSKEAQGGQVLVGEEVLALAGAVEGITFEPHGEAELKGLDAPIRLTRALSVEPEAVPSAAGAGPPPPLPPELDPPGPLVGREGELRFLRWFWRRARHGHGRAVFLCGPDGIGKSRLAAELACQVHSTGASVVYAACEGDAEEGLAALRELADGIAAPTLIIVDDVDRAAGPMLEQAVALAGAVAGRRLLLLGTYRDEDALPVGTVLGRVPPGLEARLHLAGLDGDAVAAIAALYPGGAEEIPADELMDRTGGLPGTIHALLGEQARESATARLSASATLAAKGRSGLRAAEAAVAASVVDFHQAGLLAASREPVPAVCPFKGLATFEPADAEFFFGRERLVAELVARLVGAHFLAVVGPSGSGKSSAVRAGLLPALAAGVLPGSDGWTQAIVRPGERPLAALEGAGSADVIVVDQFEELFTTCRDEEERRAFVRALTDGLEGRTVVLAIRADFYGRCAAYPELAALLGANQVLVGPMEDDEFRRVIELPARRAGLRVEPELVDVLVEEVASQPGGLPLLSSALLELWQRRAGRTLTLVGYLETGGVKGAVARLAEEAYGRLDVDQQGLVRAILLRLAGEGEGEAVVRRRAALSDFDAGAEPVLAAFTEARLLTASQGTVEVAHEALLREWPRLREWLEEDAEGRRLHLHLMQQAREWEDGGRDEADLYRGARLGSVLDWTAEHTAVLNERERAFLEASRAAHERATRRLRVGLGVVASLLALAIVAGGFALLQRSRAEDEARIAFARELAAAAQANLSVDPERSILLALEAVETTRRQDGTVLREAEEALHDALASSRTVLTVEGVGRSVAFAPDGSRFISSTSDADDVSVRDSKTGKELLALVGHEGDVRSVDYSPDGRLIATAGADGTARVWRAADGEEVAVLRAEEELISAQFDGDGSRLVTVSSDGAALLWDLRTRKTLRSFRAWIHRAQLPHADLASFGPGGLLAIVAHATGKEDAAHKDLVARVWDASSGALVAAIESDGFGPHDVDLSPDGELLAAGNSAGGIGLWRLPSGAPVDLVTGHDTNVFDVEFSPDGTRLATASVDGTAKVWEIAPSGLRELMALAGHSDWVTTVAFAPDGGSLLTGSADGTARLWDVSVGAGAEVAAFPGPDTAYWGEILFMPHGRAIVTPSGPEGTVRVFDLATRRRVLELAEHASAADPLRAVGALDVSRDGSLIATGSYDETVRVVDSATGETRLVFRGHESDCPPQGACAVSAVGFSPDASSVATTSDDGTVRFFSVQDGRQLRALERGSRDFAFGVAYSPDGGRVAVPSWDGTAKVWEVATGRLVFTVRHEGREIMTARYSPHGARLVTSGFGGEARIWDSRSGRELLSIPTGQRGVFDAVYSPDGTVLATAGFDDTIKFWDAATGREQLTLRHTGTSTRIAFSPDGKLLVGNGAVSRTVKVWALEIERLLAIAEDRVTRSLTEEECRQFLHRRCPAS